MVINQYCIFFLNKIILQKKYKTYIGYEKKLFIYRIDTY